MRCHVKCCCGYFIVVMVMFIVVVEKLTIVVVMLCVFQGWRNELKPGGATFEFSFTMLSRQRFAPPRSHSFTGAIRARNITTS